MLQKSKQGKTFARIKEMSDEGEKKRQEIKKRNSSLKQKLREEGNSSVDFSTTSTEFHKKKILEPFHEYDQILDDFILHYNMEDTTYENLNKKFENKEMIIKEVSTHMGVFEAVKKFFRKSK